MSHRTYRGRPRLSAGIWLIVVALLAAACGPTATSASPSPATAAPSAIPSATPTVNSPSAPSASSDPAADAAYDKVEQQVIAIRGLHLDHPVLRQFIDAAELKTLITQQFDQDTPPAYLAANDRLYKALGLIPTTSNLRDLSLDLLSGGVAGFYRNDQGKIYVVSKSGGPGPNERFYFSHEFDHALQDQNSTIFKDFDKVLDQSDQLLARQAIYEGDATLLMTQWASADLTQPELLEILQSSNDPAVQAVMARTPAILVDTLTFPYSTGFSYVTKVQTEDGWPAVNAYLKKMPLSTEQVLHPEKYAAGEAPVAVTMSADLATRLGSGWSVPLQDTFGEFQLGVWLRVTGATTTNVTPATAGWGGDRLAVMEGPDGAWAVAIHTEWDSKADATEFETAAKTALAKAGGVGQVLPGAGGKTRWIVVGSDDASLQRAAGALGLAG